MESYRSESVTGWKTGVCDRIESYRSVSIAGWKVTGVSLSQDGKLQE